MSSLVQTLVALAGISVFTISCKPDGPMQRKQNGGQTSIKHGSADAETGQSPARVPPPGETGPDLENRPDVEPQQPPPVPPPLPKPDPIPVPPPPPPPPPTTTENLKRLCDTPELVKSFDMEDHFLEPPVSCLWGSDGSPRDGNLGKKDQRISARREEFRALKLPPRALLCEMSLTFKDANGQVDQQMRYDDEIFVLFDDFVLAASKDYNSRLGKRGMLPVYNWANLVGATYRSDDGRPIYCIDGSGTCAIPKTETKGIFNLTVRPETVQKMALESGIPFEESSKVLLQGYPIGEHAIGMISTGDNDDPQDCKHAPLYFRVQAKYVIP